MANRILIAVLVLTGCTSNDEPKEWLKPGVTYYDLNGWTAREFKLNDGTRCVAVSQSVTCDWRNQDVKDLDN